jgi:hypothetical protein
MAADDLVVHYRGVDRLLGSPARLNVAIAIAAVVTSLLVSIGVVSGGPAVDNLAYYFAGIGLLVLLMFVYARLRFANAGLFMTGGQVGVMNVFGGRTGVDASQVDHFQLATLQPSRGRRYGVLLFIDRSGAAVLRLNVVELIPTESLQELSRRSGIPIRGSLQDAFSPTEMSRQFPRSLSRATLVSNGMFDHPYRTRLVVFAVVVVGGLVFYAVTQLLGR